MTTATAKGIPVPEETDPPLVPQDLGAVANWLDTNPGVASFTQTEIDALSAADKWIGRVVYNETTSQHQGWNATAWLPIGAGVQSFTQAQLDALPAAQKSLGMIVWNSTLGVHQAWNGTAWGWVDDMPALTTAQRDALGVKATGSVIWNTTTLRHEWWDGATWKVLNPGNAGAYGIVASQTYGQTAALGKAPAYTTIGTLAFQGIAGRRYRLGSVVGFSTGGTADTCSAQLLDGAAVIIGSPNCSPQSFSYAAVSMDYYVDCGAASRLITLTLRATATNGTVGAKVENGSLVVSDAGESAQVTTPTTIVPPDMWNAAWGIVAQIGLTTSSSPVTATTDIPGLTVTFTPIVGRRYKAFCEILAVTSAIDLAIVFNIKDGANVTLQGGGGGVRLNAIGNAMTISALLTPATAAAITVKAAIGVTGGTVYAYADAGAPSRLWVEDMGPSNPVAPGNWPPRPNPGPWTALPFSAQWDKYPGAYSVPGYRIVGDRVELRGVVRQTPSAAPAAQVIATLPVGARPPASIAIALVCQGGLYQLEARTDGTIVFAGAVAGAPTSQFAGLDGMQYSTTP